MHPRPRLNLFGRQLLIDRWEQGWSAPAVAASAGVSRATLYKWLRRYRVEGLAGLADRSSRPRSSPGRLDAAREAQVMELRRRRLGPHRLAAFGPTDAYLRQGAPWQPPQPTGGMILRRADRDLA